MLPSWNTAHLAQELFGSDEGTNPDANGQLEQSHIVYDNGLTPLSNIGNEVTIEQNIENVEISTLGPEQSSEPTTSQVQELVEDENTTFLLKHRCFKCRLRFSSITALNLHSAAHDHRFICSVCPFSARYKHELEDHLKTHLGESSRISKCPICYFITQEPNKLQEHLQDHYKSGKIRKADKTFMCSECNYATRWKWHLNDHVKAHQKQLLFKCDKCPYSTYLERYLKKHVMRHHEGRLKCNEPDCTFSTHIPIQFERHQRVHLKVLLKCERCDFSSNDIDKFAAHTNDHAKSGNRDYVCEHCSKAFTRKDLLTKHYWTHFPQNIPCKICNVICKTPAGLSTHMTKIHHTSPKEC